MLLRTMARFILSLFFFLSFTTALPADASENPTRRHNGRDDRDDRTSRYDGDATGYQSKIYFTNWGIYARNFQPQQLPSSLLTHVYYAFANVKPDGTVYSSDAFSDLQKHYATDSWSETGNNAYGCVKQLYLLKKHNRNLKVLLSIGGWTYSPNFAVPASTAAGRKKFASTAVALMKDWGLDGLDIDWEYPANSKEANNMVLLLKACREAMDAYAAKYARGYHFLLSVASPAGPDHYNTMHMKDMDAYLDSWNLMAYDYAGSWDNTTGHASNLFPSKSNPIATKFSTKRAVNDYISAGIPSQKIALGSPLYGRAFENTTLPVGGPYNGVGPGTWEAGVYDYLALPRPGAKEYYDTEVGASYSFDAKAGELVSYDTVESALKKAQWLMQKDLGGAMWWEASMDKNGTGSIVAAVSKSLGRLERKKNWLSYNSSVYANIAAGVPGE